MMWPRNSVISVSRRPIFRDIFSRARERLAIPLSSVAAAAQMGPGADQPGAGYARLWWWIVAAILIVLALWWILTAWWPSREGGSRREVTAADIPAEEMPTPEDRALEILRERYAAGEITEAEYLELRRELEERR